MIDIDEFLNLKRSGICAIDVRTPAEFEYGHMPGAVNMPLFSNEERAAVGTTYKQAGRNKAILQGLKLAGPRLDELALQGMGHAREKPALVYCWRGGMRSSSVAWLLNMVEVETCTLRKGYKNFRNYVLKTFDQPRKFVVLGGKTGSAKTRILDELEKKGEQVVDLEGLAFHRGSAFGAIGQNEKITQEQFENEFAMKLRNLDLQKTIWLEDESRHVGRIVLPLSIWENMRIAPVIFIDIPLNARIEYLTSQYGLTNDSGVLKQAFYDIKKRLGDVRYHEAISALEAGDMGQACKIALDYYDRAYEYGLGKRDQSAVRKIGFENFNMENIVERLLTETAPYEK